MDVSLISSGNPNRSESHIRWLEDCEVIEFVNDLAARRAGDTNLDFRPIMIIAPQDSSDNSTRIRLRCLAGQKGLWILIPHTGYTRRNNNAIRATHAAAAASGAPMEALS